MGGSPPYERWPWRHDKIRPGKEEGGRESSCARGQFSSFALPVNVPPMGKKI